MIKAFLIAAAVGGASAVASGAFGAHALKSRLTTELLSTWKTAVDYQFWHVLALVAVALMLLQWPGQRALHIAGWAFITGTVLFSGSLYVIAATGIRHIGSLPIGLLTPLGGLTLITGWLALLFFALSYSTAIR